MIAVIETDSGRFNIFGTDAAEVFTLQQGNMTRKELEALREEIDRALTGEEDD